MLYTVHTSFEARDNETGFMRRWNNTEKIEAPDKFTAKHFTAKFADWFEIA